MDGVTEGIALAALVAAIPGEAPAGVDLRQDFSPRSPYYRLRDARAEAREIERQSDAGPDADLVQLEKLWRTVRDIATQALAERSKDIEIAAWLTEALVRIEGPAGLARGARLLEQLAAGYWDQGLYPLPDEDGIEGRIAPIAGLDGGARDGSLPQPLRKHVLFRAGDGTELTYWQFMQSEKLEAAADPARREQMQEAGALPLEEFGRLARSADPAALAACRAELAAALEAWTAMAACIEAKAGAEAPATRRVRELLEAMLKAVARYAPAAADIPDSASPDAEAPEAAAPEEAAPEAAIRDGRAAPAAARAVTREDMLRELARIADHFRRTEPHSPLAYTLDEAVRRARLTWPELVAEVVPDAAARTAMLTMLGIRPPPDEG